MNAIYEQLREHISASRSSTRTSTCRAREEWRNQRCDVLGEYLFHYMNCDLVSAGLRREQLAEVTDPDRPLMPALVHDRALLERRPQHRLRAGPSTSPSATSTASRGSTARRSRPLNDAFCAARKAGGTYENVLKRKSKIRLSILDGIMRQRLECDRRYFAPAVRLDDFILLQNVGDLRDLAARAKMHGHPQPGRPGGGLRADAG